jgi:hypothetical protein
MRIKEWISRNSLSLGIALFFFSMQLTKWPPLRFWGWWGGGNYLDSWQVLKSADCYREIGLTVYEINNPCMLYVYGRPLLWFLSDLHIGASQTSLIGSLFIVILAFVLGTVIQMIEIVRKYQIVVTIFIITSPPILLLADRGNFDTLILGGLFLSHKFWKRKKQISALVIVFLITLFKYYTLPLLFVKAIVGRSWRVRFFGLGLCALSFLSILRDLQITQFKFASVSPHLTFGIGHEFLFFNDYESLQWLIEYSRILGIIEIAALTLVLYLTIIKPVNINDLAFLKSEGGNLYISSTLIFLTCYFSGFNADYRLVFFIVSCISVFVIFERQFDIRFLAAFALIPVLWLTFPSGDLELVGDASISIFVSFNLAILSKVLKMKFEKVI